MFQQYELNPLDTPKQLEGLYGLSAPTGDLGFVCGGICLGGAMLASGAAATYISDAINAGWDVGTYNSIMQMMNNTIGGGEPGKPGGWDQLGWEKGCWQKYPRKRKEWKAYWSLFSKHYAKYGRQSYYLSDAAENPVRKILLPKLGEWERWFGKVCGAKVSTIGLPVSRDVPKKKRASLDPLAPPGNGAPETTSGNIADIAMWGALGVGAIVVLQLTRGSRRPR